MSIVVIINQHEPLPPAHCIPEELHPFSPSIQHVVRHIYSCQRASDGAQSSDRLGAIQTDVIRGQVELLHLASRVLAQGVAQDGRTLVEQQVLADQNFGQRARDAQGVSDRFDSLRVVGSVAKHINAAEPIAREIQLRYRAKQR